MRGGRFGSYCPLVEYHRKSWSYDGEVQVLPAFDAQVADAIVARREVMPGREHVLAAEPERQAVYDLEGTGRAAATGCDHLLGACAARLPQDEQVGRPVTGSCATNAGVPSASSKIATLSRLSTNSRVPTSTALSLLAPVERSASSSAIASGVAPSASVLALRNRHTFMWSPVPPLPCTTTSVSSAVTVR